MTDYMGRKAIDEVKFKSLQAQLEQDPAVETCGTSVGDPPTCVWTKDGVVLLQYFVPWADNPEQYYAHPSILEISDD